MGILEFGDRWDLKRKMKIEEEKNKTRERRKKNKEMKQKIWQWWGQLEKLDEW